MDKKIVKIVITGGPCAGKSTGLKYIEQEMCKLGYKVVFINEVATELTLNGAGLAALEYNDYQFEKNIAKYQIFKERYYEEICKGLPDEKILIVCDRGLMDCCAYIPKEQFAQIIEELGEDFIELRDDYDGVFHLLTCAKGAEKFYTCENNTARNETIEEAREIDDRTIASWVGHPHFRVIDNSTDFDGKIKRLVKEICALIGEPNTYEIERKFLIKKPDLDYLDKIPSCEKVNIVQTYLNSEEGCETRLRQRGLQGSYIYTLTTKMKVSEAKRVEIEKRINQRQYLTMLEKTDTSLKQIRKDRYCLMLNNQYFEIDVYPFAKDKAIMEIELTSEDEKINFPEFIEVIREVTNDERYSNHSFAKKVPDEMIKGDEQ